MVDRSSVRARPPLLGLLPQGLLSQGLLSLGLLPLGLLPLGLLPLGLLPLTGCALASSAARTVLGEGTFTPLEQHFRLDIQSLNQPVSDGLEGALLALRLAYTTARGNLPPEDFWDVFEASVTRNILLDVDSPWGDALEQICVLSDAGLLPGPRFSREQTSEDADVRSVALHLELLPSTARLVDRDRDGFAAREECDDTDPSAHPGATEIWYDGVDTDCDGASDFDADRDGFEHIDADGVGGADCDDAVGAINPGADDLTADGIDANCDGVDGDNPQDLDGAWSGEVAVVVDAGPLGADVCAGTLDVVIDSAADPPLQGEGTCTFSGDWEGTTTILVEGAPSGGSVAGVFDLVGLFSTPWGGTAAPGGVLEGLGRNIQGTGQLALDSQVIFQLHPDGTTLDDPPEAPVFVPEASPCHTADLRISTEVEFVLISDATAERLTEVYAELGEELVNALEQIRFAFQVLHVRFSDDEDAVDFNVGLTDFRMALIDPDIPDDPNTPWDDGTLEIVPYFLLETISRETPQRFELDADSAVTESFRRTLLDLDTEQVFRLELDLLFEREGIEDRRLSGTSLDMVTQPEVVLDTLSLL